MGDCPWNGCFLYSEKSGMWLDWTVFVLLRQLLALRLTARGRKQDGHDERMEI